MINAAAEAEKAKRPGTWDEWDEADEAASIHYERTE